MLGIEIIQLVRPTPLVKRSLMLLDYMICMAMYLNGFKMAGMIVIKVLQAMVQLGCQMRIHLTNIHYEVALGKMSQTIFVQHLEALACKIMGPILTVFDLPMTNSFCGLLPLMVMVSHGIESMDSGVCVI